MEDAFPPRCPQPIYSDSAEVFVSKTDDMIERAKHLAVSKEDAEKQRRSFAYGNAKTENDLVTKAMVDRAAEKHPRS